MEQNRLKSPVVWGAVIAQVLSILVLMGVIDTGMSEALENLVAAFLQALAAFGVLNNPTKKDEF